MVDLHMDPEFLHHRPPIPGDNVVLGRCRDRRPRRLQPCSASEGGDRVGPAARHRPLRSVHENIAPVQPTDGVCQLGWVPADITVTANKDFMEANPVAARLLTVMDLPIVDVSIAQVEQAAGRDSEEAINETASEWIANNRDSVDGWIAEAKAAA